MTGGTLTPEQVAFYHTEGYLMIRGLLSPADLNPAREAVAAKVDEIANDLYQRGEITSKYEDSPFEHRLADLFAGLTEAHFLRYGRGWRDRVPNYFDLLTNPKILGAVESLIGGEIYANPVYNIRPKVPRVAAGAVPWHQDRSYWPDASANPVITVWVPLVAATEENGCLHIMPRTHKQRLIAHGSESYSGTSYTELDISQFKEKQVVELPMAAGDILLFNDRCIHMSTLNQSERTVRWSVDLRYQPTDQDPMPQHGVGFLARSYHHPERVARLEDWLAEREENPLSPTHE
jgi:phytanoyl-CoA hydroxylase